MSTRSVILVDSKFEEWDGEERKYFGAVRPIARLYRHSDGYVDGHGLQIMLALADASLDEGLNNRNWAQHFMAHYLSLDMDVEFEPCAGEGAFSHGDLEYVYRVTGVNDEKGGKSEADCIDDVTVEIFEVGWGSDLDRDYSSLAERGRLIFEGGWKDMARYVREWSVKNNTGGHCTLDCDYDPSKWYCANVSKTAWNGAALLSRG